MSFQTASGASLSISATLPATHDAAGFGALTPAIIGEITNIGEFGKAFETVTHQPLASRGTKKGKGSYNNGTINPQMAMDASDAGQVLMEAALESDAQYAFCVTLQSGRQIWFLGKVMAFPTAVGSVNDVVTRNSTIEIDDEDFVPIAA